MRHLAIERLRRSDSARSDKGPAGAAAEARRGEASATTEAVVIVVPSGGNLRVVRADSRAYRGGVRAGQTLAEAGALAPGLKVHHHDVRADRRALEALAAWADCLSPVVHLEGEDCLLLDVTGCERLFGGEDEIVRRAREGLAEQGYTAAAALADTPGAAWALAHAEGREVVVSPPGRVAASLAHLPVWSLRIEPEVARKLWAVGVKTIEALLHLPRASLARRFGEQLLRRLDQALGDAPELLVPFRPPPVIRAQVRFSAATERLELLREAVDQALAVFCERLAHKVWGARQVCVTFYFPRHFSPPGHRTIALEVSRPTRDRAHLRSLLWVRLDGLKLHTGVEALMLWTRRVESLDDVQQTWLDTGDAGDTALADLIDRLAVRMGAGAAVRAQLLDDHQPEMAYAYVSLAGGHETDASFPSRNYKLRITNYELHRAETGNAGLIRPLRLLACPVEVPVMAVVPNGPPVRFRFGGITHEVVCWSGPERVETGWWRGRQVRRDYFRAESDTHCLYWLFQEEDTGRWFVHGVFD